MNNKVLVKIYVPKIEERYDMLIPLNKKIGNVIPLLVKAVKEMSRGYYNPQKRPEIYNRLNAKKYDLNDTIKKANIKNGTEIILI